MSGPQDDRENVNVGSGPPADGAVDEKQELPASTTQPAGLEVPQQNTHQPDPQQHGGESEQGHAEKQTNGNTGTDKSEKPLTPTPQDPAEAQPQDPAKKKGPPGGYDATPVPHAPPGYTVRITFHRATQLPIGDLPTLSSDPYLRAHVSTDLTPRHDIDPDLSFRSRTVFKTTNPVWDEAWIIEHVPASGLKMKTRIYDEDRGDRDDRLGNVHVTTGRIDERWEGIHDQPYKVKKRMGSKRAYALRGVAVCFRQVEHMSGDLYVSVEVLGRSSGQEGGRAFTAGPNYWCKHYSPFLGRLAGSKAAPEEDSDGEDEDQRENAPDNPALNIPGAKLGAKRQNLEHEKSRKPSSTYNFQANQFQLTGPVPPELYHRYVEFKPFIKALFTSKGLRGLLMHEALHHQHAEVYNFNSHTQYGVFSKPCEAMTQRFLHLCHYGEGGRIFTYVLTLDALMRFTETGKEFGIDMLSKHTMHSDASIYIAFSGEFFIRQRQDEHHHHHHDHPNQAAESPTHAERSDMPSPQPANPTSSQPDTTKSDKPQTAVEASDPAPTTAFSNPRTTTAPPNAHSPSHYELIIDNDSGTYRPNASLLPLLRTFLSSNFPGLKIITLDCNSDAELMNRLKSSQREKKQQAHKQQAHKQQAHKQQAHKQQAGPSLQQHPTTSSRSSTPSLSSQGAGAAAGPQAAHEADVEAGVDRQLVNDADRREAQRGTGEGKRSGSPEGGREAPQVMRPKHRINEAVLPFFGQGRVREYLTEPEPVEGAAAAADA